MKLSQSIELAIAASIFPSLAQGALYSAPVEISTGYVQGYQALTNATAADLANWQNITVWKGIPFAATTAGNNRWKPPQPAPKLNGTFLASTFGPGCAQASGGFGKRKRQTSSSGATSEDCLSVNIWSPATSADEKLPVAVWSYGAGATSSDDTFDGAGLASKGIVMVTYNYRTGPFGWLTLPALDKENAHNSSGNYGLLDQIEVLKWVKANIASFGGDADHVTTVGQSFGSGAVLHTINSPLAKGLIVGAIAESGIKSPYDPDLSGFGSNYQTSSFLVPFSETFVKSLNVTTLAELRALPEATVLTGTGASAFTGFDPLLDYWAIPSTYEESLLKGPANDVPVLAGNNLDEDGVDLSTTYNVTAYEAALQSRYNATYAAEFLKLYPAGSNTTSATLAYNDQLQDAIRISTWSWASMWAKTAKSPVYTYLWDHSPPGSDGATHASEIPYVLNTLSFNTGTSYNSSEYAISDVMSTYWANFIKTGCPNSPSTKSTVDGIKLATWPVSSSGNETTFNVGDSYRVVDLATFPNPAKKVALILNWWHNVTEPPY